MTLYSKFDISKKIAIVVGGSGQLGSSTIKILLEANCLVINLDLYEKK
jgi:NAD(P)-dependent dehydrogenase (short-subunit alcohol dehydrogenase family)